MYVLISLNSFLQISLVTQTQNVRDGISLMTDLQQYWHDYFLVSCLYNHLVYVIEICCLWNAFIIHELSAWAMWTYDHFVIEY